MPVTVHTLGARNRSPYDSGVPTQRDSTRARDVDRTNTRWLLDAAYAEGQLGAGEYHDRIALAASADTLGELRNLSSDLQLSASIVSTHPVGRRSVRGRVVAATAAVGAGLVAGVVALIVGGSEPDAAAPAPPAAAPAETESDPGADTSPPDLTTPIDPFTAAGIDTVIAQYRFQFGDTTSPRSRCFPTTCA